MTGKQHKSPVPFKTPKWRHIEHDFPYFTRILQVSIRLDSEYSFGTDFRLYAMGR